MAVIYQRRARLIKILQSNPALGLLIRSLEGISSVEITSFVSLLKCSPRVLAIDLDLAFGTPPVSRILGALNSLVGVKKLSIKCPYSPSDDWRSITLEILASPAFASLENLRIRTRQAQKKPCPNISPALQLKSLVIDSSFDTFEAVAPVLPANMTTLESLTMNNVEFTTADMLDLLESLETATHSLSLSAGGRDSMIFASTYRNNHHLPHISSHPFTSLPNLTALSLHHTQGPSLELLRTLASSCRQLVKLDFFSSVWTSDVSFPSSLTAEEHFDLVFPQQAILSALEPLSELEGLNMGYLMDSDDEEKFSRMMDVLEGRGVEVDWNLVVSEEPDVDDDNGDEHASECNCFRCFRYDLTQGGPRLSV